MFDDMVVSGQKKQTHKHWTVMVSSAAQAFLLGILIMIPLISYSELPKGFNATYLAAPPPPPAPAPSLTRELDRPRRLIPIQNLVAPTRVPTRVEIIREPEPFVDFHNGVSDGMSGSGLIGDLVRSNTPVPPSPVQQPERIRVGGQVEAARLIHQTIPGYPGIARTVHVQGTVVLHAIIGKDGSITSLQYVSGPALLMKAAEDAVATWRYQPLVLNGQPTEVETEISVVFTLNE